MATNDFFSFVCIKLTVKFHLFKTTRVTREAVESHGVLGLE